MKGYCSISIILYTFCVFSFGCGQTNRTKSNQRLSAKSLAPGMGLLHHPIATKNPEAARFFDQGLTFVYAFNFNEGLNSFEKARELDPDAPMPYWGMALAIGPHYNDMDDIGRSRMQQGVGYIQQAKDHTDQQHERDYVEALAARFTQDPTISGFTLAQSYAGSMRALAQQHPDDPDAAVLFAESLMDLHRRTLWTSQGQPSTDTPEIETVLERTLMRWPDHVGANHLYIHLMESSPFPERALPSAHRLENLVPSAGHLVHMPSHIFLRIGDYASAIKSNQDAIAADNRYFASYSPRGGTSAYGLFYAEHNLLFLNYVAAIEGDYETSLQSALALDQNAQAALARTSQAEAYMVPAMITALRFGRSKEVLALAAPTTNLLGLSLFWHYVRGSALAEQGLVEEAKVEQDAMQQVYQRIPSGLAFGMLPNTWESLFDIANECLSARISEASHDVASAIKNWQTAIYIEDHLIYHEPPDWFYPVRESLGGLLLRIGRTREAEKTFREDLLQHPLNPRSLFGLSTALNQEGRNLEAQHAIILFRQHWKGVLPDIETF